RRGMKREGGKNKETRGRAFSHLCPPYATPSSNSSLDYRRSDARIVENGFATTGVSKSAKVVLGMRVVLLASIAFGLLGSSVLAQDRKGIRFWNLTLYTITTFQMSPAGEESRSPDQHQDDSRETVDHRQSLCSP